jgi:hypothetical protein
MPSVKLDLDVIQQMTVDIMRGFGVTRRRGTEVGGVLLGRIVADGDPSVLIDDYETVPCEYSQGPSYVLSERDLEKFHEVTARWSRQVSPDQYAVGYFRSHTRAGLRLNEVDVSQFHQHFDDPLAVVLLVKPFATKASEASFFVQSNGRLDFEASAYEFPFVTAEQPVVRPEPPETQTAATRSAAMEREIQQAPEPEAALPAVSIPVTQPKIDRPNPTGTQSEAPRLHERTVRAPAAPPVTMFGAYAQTEASRWRTKALWIAFTLAVFGFGALAGYQYAGGDIQGLSVTPQTQVLPAQAASDRYNAGLSAVIQDGGVLVRWDRDSEAIRSALRGVLTITENAASKQVVLDASELKNGTVLYHNAGPEIGFKLDLYFKENRMFTENVAVRILPADVSGPR